MNDFDGPTDGPTDAPVLNLHPALATALSDKGYDKMTPVQLAMLDPANSGADMLVSAQTGSGKTVAFGLAMAPTLLGEDTRFGPAAAPLTLIIAPTRELAMQVRREFEWLYASTGAVIASCIGGMDIRTERRALERGAHIVVGTPGRLRDHIERSILDMSDLRVAVLDEADEMLDLGFREDLEYILQAAPDTRRTLLFSATVSRDIARLAQSYQRDAVRVQTTSEREQHHDIEYRALVVDASDRENAIVNVLRYYEAKNALVFCATRATVNHLTARFNNRGFQVVALSGELSQQERTHALQAMRDGRARVCVATDVAARGIDLPGLELVVHADLPNNRETLLHRSGRTGRAGSKGVSAVIVPANARKKAERLLGSAGVKAEWASAPSADEVTARDQERLLSDPIFTAPVDAGEQDLVTLLMSNFAPEALAAGFARQYMAARSAPEELREPGASKARERDEFANSFWISLSVGAEQRAEPRWILPMLCRSAGLSKRDIGAIRVQGAETFVQIHGDARERLFGAIGPDMSVEDGIRLKESSAPAGGGNFSAPRPERAPRPPREDRAPREERGPREERSSRDDRPARPAYDRPANDDAPARKPRAAKPRPLDLTAERPARSYDAPSEGAPKTASRKPRLKPAYDPDAGHVPMEAPAPRRPRADAGDGPAKPYAPKGAAASAAARRAPMDASDTSKRYAPAGAYQGGKPSGKPFGKPFGKPDGAGRPEGRSFGKPGGKPAGGAGTGRSSGKPGGKPGGGKPPFKGKS